MKTSLTNQDLPKRIQDPFRGALFWTWILITFVAGIVVFRLPWEFASTVPVKSESYAFGFNNSIAIFGLTLCIAIAGLTFLIMGGRFFRDQDPLDWITDQNKAGAFLFQGRIGWSILIIFSLVEVALVLWWNHLLIYPYWGESAYFLSRLDLVALGYLPYLDFQHLYGPLMLYFPLWVERLSLGLLGLENAYAISICISYLAGNFCFFVFLSSLRLKPHQFFLLLISGMLLFLPLTMGLNYAPLRFTLVPGLLAAFYFLDGKVGPSSLKVFSRVLASSFGGILAFGVSPEMGLSLCAGLAGYAMPGIKNGRWADGLATLSGFSLAVCFFLLFFGWGYFHGVFAVQGGGNNFPIYPNLHNLCYLFSLMLVFPFFGASALWHSKDHRAPLALAYCLSGGVLISAAMGRCDPGHVFLNGLIPLMLMTVAVQGIGPKAALGWTAFFLVCVTINLVSYLSHYEANLRQVFVDQKKAHEQPENAENWQRLWEVARAESPAGERLRWGKLTPISTELMQFVAKEQFVMFGFFDLGLDRLLKLKEDFHPSYHPLPVAELYSPRDVDRVVTDLLSRSTVLIPEQLIRSGSTRIDTLAYQQGWQSFLSGLMFFPVRSNVRYEPYSPDLEVIRKLLPRCEISSSPLQGLVVVKPHSAAPPP